MDEALEIDAGGSDGEMDYESDRLPLGVETEQGPGVVRIRLAQM
jgi:hypothetical protein